jgi:hypothetical protein
LKVGAGVETNSFGSTTLNKGKGKKWKRKRKAKEIKDKRKTKVKVDYIRKNENIVKPKGRIRVKWVPNESCRYW